MAPWEYTEVAWACREGSGEEKKGRTREAGPWLLPILGHASYLRSS